MAELEISFVGDGCREELDNIHSFKKLSQKRFPKVDVRESSELRFWSKFKFPVTVKEYNTVTSIHFSPTAPHDYVVTSGSRLQVYGNYSNKVKKTLSRFSQMAYSGYFRHDGQLIAAGSEEGVVKVFDVNSRAILRQFKGHTKPTKAVCFSSDGLRLFSGSDDTLLRCWDLSTQTCTHTLPGHQDYVRAVAASPVSPEFLLSSSYDHSVKLWDMRCSSSPVMGFCHEFPVEGVLMFPSGGMCVSCGGQWVRVWELLAGGRSLVSLSNHQKTVMAVCFDSSGSRLLSAGLDKQVKVYSVESYGVLHSMSYPAPILSVAMAPRDSHVVVGMNSKLLSIKHVASDTPSTSLPFRAGSHRYFARGNSYVPAPDEYVLPTSKKLKLKSYEELLKKFKYQQALLAVFQGRQRPKVLVVYSLLQELARREGLRVALAGLDENQLEPVLKYLARNLSQPQCAPLLLDVANIVADIYGSVLGTSDKTRALFRLVKVKVDRELEFHKQAFQLLGCLDTLLTSSFIHSKN